MLENRERFTDSQANRKCGALAGYTRTGRCQKSRMKRISESRQIQKSKKTREAGHVWQQTSALYHQIGYKPDKTCRLCGGVAVIWDR